MKICFLAPANNYHTEKWCKWFVGHGHEVEVVSFINGWIDNVKVHYIDAGVSSNSGDLKKLRYLLKARDIKKLVDGIEPDIVNVHYATSYGTAAALSGLNKYVLSVWGKDIYEFPQKSLFHKAILKYSLHRAGYIFSTSHVMAKEVHKYTNKKIEITPFGVDMQLFNPNKRKRTYQDTSFVVGTVKALTEKYGIDYLIRAVSLIKKEHPEIPVCLRIAGKGEKADEYKQLAVNEGVDKVTTWLGFISQEEAAKEWANMDVAVIASISESESFGVSAVEAQACGTPVIISDVPGLMETTIPGLSSLIVRRCNERAIADALLKLFYDNKKREQMGREGRDYVLKKFALDECFEEINKVYNTIISGAENQY
ncbi:MAG: glycosyltransferase family 4 protein [Lachnospiraceae bacterium]|nr:glycosyltransferase family 4 protein [Lachnospiraceae bacterium]